MHLRHHWGFRFPSAGIWVLRKSPRSGETPDFPQEPGEEHGFRALSIGRRPDSEEFRPKPCSRPLWGLLPQKRNGYAYGSNSNVSLTLKPLRLIAGRWREQGFPPCMLQIDIEDAFGAVRFETAWRALKQRLGARRSLPLSRFLLEVRVRVS